MQKKCLQCSAPFNIAQSDVAFYEKVSPVIPSTGLGAGAGKRYDIPSPTLCPACRMQRRFAWRNERNLYHRTCDLSGKTIITNFSPSSGIKVYEHHEWWSDKWDAKEYGRDVAFNRPFFEQFTELQQDVPQLGLSVWNSENSDYCNYVGHVRNSYLIFGSVYSEDCYYGSPYYSKDCVDTLVVRECELCYECIDCRKLHTCFYCQDCHSSNDLIYCFDLQGCNECIGCAGLRQKKFCIFNEELSKEEYRKRKAELDLCVPSVHDLLRSRLRAPSLQIPHRYMQSHQVQDVSGNYVYQSKHVHDSYYADRCEDCRYCAQVVDLKDCHDNNYTEENELCFDYLGAYQVNHLCFSKFCNQVSDSLYCDACHASQNLFGCIGLKRSSYCILNKQYTKEEYEELVPKIIEHMRKTPYNRSGAYVSSAAGQQMYEWGQFFPPSISPFGYNETVASEYFPLSREKAVAKGFRWYDDIEKKEQYLGPAVKIPQHIEDVSDDICDQILPCEVTGKLFKIIPQELKFYREMRLPIPRKCPDQRHSERLAMRNPRKLWDRACGKCLKAMRTTYSPERPERVYCEECYLSTVY